MLLNRARLTFIVVEDGLAFVWAVEIDRPCWPEIAVKGLSVEQAHMFPDFELLQWNASGAFDVLNWINLLFGLPVLVELSAAPDKGLRDLLPSRIEGKAHLGVDDCSDTVAVFIFKHALAGLVIVEIGRPLITVKFHKLGIGKLAFVVWIKLVEDQLLFCGWKTQANSVASRFKFCKTNLIVKGGVEESECLLQIFEPLLNSLPEYLHKLTDQIITSLAQAIADVGNLGRVKRRYDLNWWLVLLRPYHKWGEDKEIAKPLQKIKFYYLLSTLFRFWVYQNFHKPFFFILTKLDSLPEKVLTFVKR